MSPPFGVRADAHFERLAQSLRKHHPGFESCLIQAAEILKADPYNHSRSYAIKKLVDVPRGKGEYRLRLRRWRFRYDV